MAAKQKSEQINTSYPENILKQVKNEPDLIIHWEEDEKWIGFEVDAKEIGLLYTRLPILIYITNYRQLILKEFSNFDFLILIEVEDFTKSLFKINDEAKETVFGRLWKTNIINNNHFSIKELIYATN